MARERRFKVVKRKQAGFVRRLYERIVFLAVMALPLGAGLAVDRGVAHAFNLELGEDAGLDFDVSLTYGGSWRVKDQDRKLVADPNADDGNRNFDKWDMINNRLSALIDIDLHYKNYGLFVRPRAYFDFAYDGDSANDSPTTFNNGPLYGGPLSSNRDFDPRTKDLHRDKSEILDAFAYSNFDLGGQNLVLRVGRQVVSWGESLFVTNGISSAQSPLDATAANAPGVELKDIFLPVGQVYSQVDLWRNFTLAGFYQWEWDKTRLDEAGSYFSTSDLLDDAGRRVLVPVMLDAGLAATIDKVGDDDPSSKGQWGIALRYLAEALNDTEFGLYYINYHEKLPQIIGQFGGGQASRDWGTLIPDPATAGMLNLVDSSSYFLSYAEDVELYGASFGTVIGDTNVAGEVSYRQDLPVQVVDPANILAFSYQDADVLQLQLSAIHIFRASPLWDNLTVTAEGGVNRVVSGPSGNDLVNDRSAWGGTVKAAFDYFQILQELDLQVNVTYNVNPNGISSVLGTFAEDQDSIAVNLDFTCQQVYKLGLGYTEFLHSANKNPKADRDFLSLNLKYTF